MNPRRRRHLRRRRTDRRWRRWLVQGRIATQEQADFVWGKGSVEAEFFRVFYTELRQRIFESLREAIQKVPYEPTVTFGPFTQEDRLARRLPDVTFTAQIWPLQIVDIEEV